MGSVTFVGLGLDDERGMTLGGLEEARRAGTVFIELYTNLMPRLDMKRLEQLVGKQVLGLTRIDVEDNQGKLVVNASEGGDVAFLVPGDPMAATTHVDLRLRAAAAKIPTRIVHGVSVLTAAAGALGLQAYKFGRTTTIPFPAPGFVPTSPMEAILANRRAGLHTLVLLDLREGGTFLDPRDAIRSLLEMASAVGTSDFGPGILACVLSRVGAPDVRAVAGSIGDLTNRDLGPPLHCLVIPGTLHFLEKESLVAFAGAPHDL